MTSGRINTHGVGGLLAGLILLGVAPSSPAVQAADTEYYRRYDRACVAAMLDYAWTRLAPAVQARSAAAGQVFPAISSGRWQSSRDTRFYTGPAGWTTPENTPGLLLTGVLFRDADGNGRYSASEVVWLDADGDKEFDAGEALLAGPAAAVRVGARGRAFPDRLYTAATWGPGLDVWLETAAADAADLNALHAALTSLLGCYVNPLEEPAWDGGTSFARSWTTSQLLAALNQPALLAPPAALDGSFAAARSLEAWLRQAVALVDLLQLRRAPDASTRGQKKSAFACRGPYYALHYATEAFGWCGWPWHEPYHEGTLLLCMAPGGPVFDPAGAWRDPDVPPYSWEDVTLWAERREAEAAPVSFRYVMGNTRYCGTNPSCEHVDGYVEAPRYLGEYQGVLVFDNQQPDDSWMSGRGAASVTVEDPPRNAFWLTHSLGSGEEVLPLWTILPSSTSLAPLLAGEWAAAEWQTVALGSPAEVRAYRWESDTAGYWDDAHGSALGQEWQESTATLSPPAGVATEVYVYIVEKQGAPDLFAGKAAGRFWRWSRLAPGPGGPLEIAFAPVGFPSVPNPVYPGGEYEATTRQRFTVYGVLDYRGLPSFAPLPTPPGASLPKSVFGTQDLDTNRDDLVDPGLDLVSFGPDTGALALQPEWTHPQALIPLAVALWDELPVHAFLCQGATAGANLEWLHPDADEQPFAFSLHSRATIEELRSTPTVHRKLASVVRPRGNTVAFEFAWDAAVGAFAALGFPLAPNQRRTYVLRDLTPTDDLDASFELAFDSGVIHTYAGGRLAEGALIRVRHTDGRAVEISRLSDCAFNLNANTFSSPRCHGVLTWSGGYLRRLDYTWRCGGGRLGVDLVYASTPAGPWVTALAKTLPELSLSHAGGFGFAGGVQTVSFGSGVTVSRNGDSLTTVWPSGGTLTQSTRFNADGLPTRLETIANGSSHATDFLYAGGNSRYPANGAPAWSKLTGIQHPDGSWERFAYAPTTGWLTAHSLPWAEAVSTDPETLCQVTRFTYDRALSAGDAANPVLLLERPRSVVSETLGVETARTYHAYGLEAGRRYLRSQRTAAVGAVWGQAGNLESVLRFNPCGPPDLTTPTGWVRYTVTTPRDDRLTLTETASSGQTLTLSLNALGQTLSSRCTEAWGGFPLATSEAWSGIDSFGRPVRTDHLDGTFELFNGRQWHGGPLQHTCADGSVETFTYFPDGRVSSRTHYGVTTTCTYDALGNLAQEQRRADALSLCTRTQYDSQGRQTLFEDELRRRTVSTYSGMNRTLTHPDGSRQAEERFLDGRPKHISGNAVAEEQIEPGVAAAGTWSRTSRRTHVGFTDVTYAYTDRLGRPWQSARSLERGTVQVMDTTSFDAQGRPCRRVDADGVTALTEYNERNEISRTALDLDRDGRSGAADRITTYTRQVLVVSDPLDGAEVTGTRRTVTAPDGALTESFAAADGLRSWVSVNGRLTHTATVLGAGPGQRTVTTTFPDRSARVELYDQALLRQLKSLAADGEEIISEAYEYDALRRLVRTRNGRTGVVTTVELDAAGQVTCRTRSDSKTAEEADYDPRGRTTLVRQRGGGEVLYDYDPTGRLNCASGADTPPRRYQYDPRGLRTGQRTYRDGLDGAGEALTEWRFDDYSGRLSERRLAGNPVEAYGYSAAGRLLRLVRGLPTTAVTTTFTRNAAGEVLGLSHSDGSAGVTVARDRSGRPVQVTDASGSRDLVWNRDGRIVSETLPQLPGGVLLSTYDRAGRRTALTLSLNGSELLSWTRAYDPVGRLASVSDGYTSAHYQYLADSNLVERTVYTAAGVERLRLERDWDTENRLVGILAQTPGAAEPVASWTYTLDADGRRTAVDLLLADPAATAPVTCRWEYAYDPLGQLRTAVCLNPANGAVLAGRDFAYDHDTIGNRKTAGRIDPVTTVGEERYTANDLNQYSVRSTPGAVYVSGWADPAATVTVNGTVAGRDGAAFHLRLPVDNRSGPVTLALTLRAARWDTAKGLDLIAEAATNISVPAANELLTAADQGSLAADSLRLYQWDLDDRLLSLTPTVPTAQTPKLTFTYDAQGRRTAKRVFRFVVPPSGAAGSWVLFSETVFVYDGWTLLAEFSLQPSAFSLQRSYLWGLDLEGLRTGQPDGGAAQGVGGLVAFSAWNVPGALPKAQGATKARPASRFAVADANGSIAVLVDANPTDPRNPVLETVEYEPFGRVLSRSRADAGPLPAQAEPLCPFGFSSRYLDSDTGLLYFGYRYYTPDLGRWLCRDPLQEQAGPNLYAYCQNDPINQIDPLGLWAEGGHYYTVLYVAQAAGWEFGEALQLAAYSQAPDEIGKYEAVKSLHDSTQAQERLHCLNGADAVPLRGRLEAVLAPDTGLDVAETGVLLHVLGDAYSHSREVSYPTGYRTESITLAGETFEEQTPIWGRKEVCFPRLVGHAATVVTKGCSGSEPDAIGRHPELYKQYVEDLYSLLCALRPNAPREQNGFAIGNLFDLAKGEMSRSPITSMGGYNFRKEAEALFGLFNTTRLVDKERDRILQPQKHDVKNRSTVWDALRVEGWPEGPNAIIEGVMGLDY